MLVYGERRKQPNDIIAAELVTEDTDSADLTAIVSLTGRYSIALIEYYGGRWRVVLDDLVKQREQVYSLQFGDYLVYDGSIDTVFMQPAEAWQRMYSGGYTNEFLELDN